MPDDEGDGGDLADHFAKKGLRLGRAVGSEIVLPCRALASLSGVRRTLHLNLSSTVSAHPTGLALAPAYRLDLDYLATSGIRLAEPIY